MLVEHSCINNQDIDDFGELYVFKSNEPLLLDNSETIWLVKSGALALFAISVENGTPKGRRRYLSTVKAGEAMFSAATCSLKGKHQILAVSLEDSRLLRISKHEFCELITRDINIINHNINQKTNINLYKRKKNQIPAIQLIEKWVSILGSSVSTITSSKFPTPSQVPGCAIFAEGEVFQPPYEQIVWVKVLQGQANLLGLDNLEITPNTGRIPLEKNLWLQARAEVIEIDSACITSPDCRVDEGGLYLDSKFLLNGLHELQNYVLQAISQVEHQETQAELARASVRERLNNQAITSTLSGFASIFESETKAIPTTQIDTEDVEKLHIKSLLFAASVVGKVLGISIKPPASSENLQRVRDPLDAIARASGIRVRRITLQNNWWKQDSGPLVAYKLEDNRPVALLPVSETSYEIIDPILQKRLPCNQKIAATLSPVAYTFYRPLPEAQNFLSLMKFALYGRSKEMLTIILGGVATTLLGMVTPQATALIIDQAIHDANDKSLLLQLALGLVVTTIGATLFQLTQGFALMRLETYADTTTQAAVWDRLLTLKPSFFRSFSIGDLSARVSVITQIRQKLSNTLLKSFFSSVFSLLNLGLLFYYSFPLAIIATLVALVNVVVTIISGILTIKKVRPLLNQQGKLFGMMVQIIGGVAKFRTAGAEARAFAYWGSQYRQQLQLTMASQSIEDNLVVVNNILSALTPAVMFGCATSLLTSQDSFTTGTFLAFNAAFGTFISGATSLSTTVVDILEILPLWERAQPILKATPEVDTTKADPGRLTGKIEIKNVVFRYRNDGPITLDDISIKAEPGEFIALVGPSGSGKSTLFRLLLGFDAPESGSLYFDGQDLAGLDINAVRRQLGVVLQNSRLMSASIFENISSNAVLSMEEAWEAAQMAGLADDINSMPMKMHTVVSEGATNLSGGQRQRLLIARALALRPRILLFDEATSALDNRTQAIVSESLEKLNVTRIVVAHRLSTIRNADKIYVLQNGKLVQQGNFDQLAQEPGLFSQLIRRQKL
ncbi:MAG: NHLP bacteriocin export ABC transporter permease/ATPase subunit [Calothrix sp. C42_A2020_038]|nr:NHLP bacteriocin export ABC transporter permease/ATPase subunit [Calothrix sp. C42_A2020_038]